MSIGVKFGNKHTYRDFRLLMSSRLIGLPTVQISKTTDPGRDGDLDLTEALDGNIHYGNRTLEMTFAAAQKLTGKAWGELLSDFAFHIHGRRLEIIFDDDPDHAYTGRCVIANFDHRISTADQTITVSCDCQPFRIALAETVMWANVNPAYRTITIQNGRMPSVPVITFSAPCYLMADGEEYFFDAGTYSSKDLTLAPGENTVYIKTASDIATAEIRFRKGEI